MLQLNIEREREREREREEEKKEERKYRERTGEINRLTDSEAERIIGDLD